MGDGQAGVVGCKRQRDGDLAVILLAEVAAVLPGDADRMHAFLRNAGVVDHPAADPAAPLDDRQHMGAHGGQQRVVGPVRLGDEMMQRLVRRLDTPRLHARRHRLDALAGAGQQQARAVGPERRCAVGVPERARQSLDIDAKA